MLNDRQVASLLWVGIVLVTLLVWPTGRRSFAGVARAFLSRKIWPIFALLNLWSLGLVLVGRRVGIWTDDLAADTWFWFFTTAVVLLFNFTKASEEPDFFRRTATETFGFTLVLGFLSDLFVLSVPVEFVGQGVVAVLASVSAVAAHLRALSYGATATSLNSTPKQVAEAIEARFDGNIVVPETVLKTVVTPPPRLTSTERAVLSLLAKAAPLDSVAQRMGYSERHIRRVRKAILSKAGTDDPLRAAEYFSIDEATTPREIKRIDSHVRRT